MASPSHLVMMMEERPAPAEGTVPSLARGQGLPCHTRTMHIATVLCSFSGPNPGKISPEHLNDLNYRDSFKDKEVGLPDSASNLGSHAAQLSALVT